MTTRGRLPGLTVACALTAALLAACAPAGADGNLTDDWPAAPGQLKPFTPGDDVCHEAGFTQVARAATYAPIDCTESHRTETVHVGTVRGDGSSPPADGSTAAKAAYRECEEEAEDFLGEDWRGGKLWLGVALPTANAWRGGARWFRCDLVETASEDDDTPVARKKSLKDALRDERPVGLGCSTMTSDGEKITETKFVDCSRSHNAEFVGVYVPSDGPYKELTAARWDSYHTGCRALVAKYVGISASQARSTGTVADPFSEEEWERGNRGVRCHIWLDAKRVSRSVKGTRRVPT